MKESHSLTRHSIHRGILSSSSPQRGVTSHSEASLFFSHNWDHQEAKERKGNLRPSYLGTMKLSPHLKEIGFHALLHALQSWQEMQQICQTQNLSPTKFQFSSVPSLSGVWLFATPWIAARQASLSITNSHQLKLMSIESVMPSSHVIILVILLCLLQTYLFNFYLVFWLLSFLLLNTSSRHSNFPSEQSFALNNDLRPEHMGRYWNNLISPRRFYPSPATSHFPSAPEIVVNSS